MPAMSSKQWDSASWGTFTMAPGDPEQDALDRRHTVTELAEIVGENPEYVVELVRSNLVKHKRNPADSNVVTISLSEWNERGTA